jgi:hypothetical protein
LNANAKFVRRFHEMERLAANSGRKFDDVPRPEKEELWNAAKLSETSRNATASAAKQSLTVSKPGQPR